MLEERWLPVVGFDMYAVSDQGRVMNVKTRRVIKPVVVSRGRLRVCLSRLGQVHRRYVHRLVCTAFHGGNPDLEVNHKDLDFTNNASTNLEWVTRKQNMAHYSALTNDVKHVLPMDLQCDETGVRCSTIAMVEDYTGDHSSYVISYLMGKRNLPSGYTFTFVDREVVSYSEVMNNVSAMAWSNKRKAPYVRLVGSDLVFDHAAHAAIELGLNFVDVVKVLKGEMADTKGHILVWAK